MFWISMEKSHRAQRDAVENKICIAITAKIGFYFVRTLKVFSQSPCNLQIKKRSFLHAFPMSLINIANQFFFPCHQYKYFKSTRNLGAASLAFSNKKRPLFQGMLFD